MKSYLKYIVLFIILVAIGIVGINLYSNQTFKNINSKTGVKQTSNEENNKTTTQDNQQNKTTDSKEKTESDSKNTTSNETTSSPQTDSSNNTTSNNNESTNSSNQVTSSSINSQTKENTTAYQEEANEIEVEEKEENDSIQNYTNNTVSNNNEVITNNTNEENSSSNNFVIEVDPSIYEESTDNTKTVIYPTYPTEDTTNNNTNDTNNNTKSNTESDREIPKTIIKPTTPTPNSQITKITLNKTMITLGLEASVTSIGKTYSTNKTKLSVNEAIKNDKIVWSIQKGNTVAKVDSNGNVTALHGGTATVRASLASNSSVYADCQVTVVHGLYENVKITSKITVKDIYTGKSITLESGKKVVLLGELKYKRHDYKNNTYTIRIDNNNIAKISGKYLKFLSYYVDDGYTNQVYENFINDIGFTSKTNYLIWVNRGTQRLMLFKKENSKWKIVENFKTSTGDSEGKYTGDSGGSTVTRFNLEVQDFNAESSVGRAIHVRYETTKKNHGNTMHVGSLPKNTAGGNSSENAPASHGCPHLSTSFRNKLYNTYNGGSKNKLINSKVIYY